MSTLSTYFERIEGVSSSQLLEQAVGLVARERRQTALLIAHLAEISRRQLHLEIGFKSLFDYCVQRLGLSEGSAALRIQVANVCREHPALLEALGRGRISLSVAGKLAAHLTLENREALLSACAGLTKREVEEYLTRIAPKPEVTPGIRRQPSRPAAPVEATATTGDSLFATPHAPMREPSDGDRRPRRGAIEPCRPDTYNVRFSATRQFTEKLERLAEVLGVQDAMGEMAIVLEKAIDLALEKKDPQKRQERRLARQSKGCETAGRQPPRPDEVAGDESPVPASPPSRHVPDEVRDRVLCRAGHQCEYVGAGGPRCRQRTGLHVDHRRPFARHRSHEESALRALCPAHNLLYAKQTYGVAFIADKIATSRAVSRSLMSTG